MDRRTKYHGNGVEIQWVRGQYIMDRRVIISGKCVNIPWEGDQNTMTLYPWCIDILPMVFRPPNHGILIPLPME
jgi:hypothetical protein